MTGDDENFRKWPPTILAKISGHLAVDGVETLKNLILAGPEMKDAALSFESLSRLNMSIRHDYPWWSDPYSYYYRLFLKCVVARNPYTLYVDCLRLAFKASEINVALYILNDIKDVFPHAKIMFIMLSFCAGRDCLDVFNSFRKKFPGPATWSGCGLS